MQFRYRYNDGPEQIIKNMYTNFAMSDMLYRCFQDQENIYYLELSYRLITAYRFKGISVYDLIGFQNWSILDDYSNDADKRSAYIWKPKITIQNGVAILTDSTDKSLVIQQRADTFLSQPRFDLAWATELFQIYDPEKFSAEFEASIMTVVGMAMINLQGHSTVGNQNDYVDFLTSVGNPYSMSLFPQPIVVATGDKFTVNYEMVW